MVPCVNGVGGGLGGSGVGAGGRVAKPSIGPSIGEMSMAMTGSVYSQPMSASGMDNDSVRAIAPASLDGNSVNAYNSRSVGVACLIFWV